MIYGQKSIINALYLNEAIHFEDETALAQRTAEYFQDWSPAPRFDNETLEVRERAERGNYLALLCEDKAGEWCMSLWQRDELFPDRYCPIGGRVRVDPGTGGLLVWNFGDPENAVVVTSGVELPEEVCRYEWDYDFVGSRGNVDWYTNTVLDICVVTFSDQWNRIYPRPRLYDDFGKQIY